VKKITSILILSLVLMGSAFSAPFTSADPDYVGYIGNLDIGRLDGSGGVNSDIGTDWIANPDMQDVDFDPNGAVLDVGISTQETTVHLYRFALDSPSMLKDFVELGSGTSLQIDFFHDSAQNASTPFVSVTRDAGTVSHDFQQTSTEVFDAGIWWMRVTGTTASLIDGGDGSYKVSLSKVPLPPALLLFISALAGFGVIGRKRETAV
jgi:hypothetical protein